MRVCDLCGLVDEGPRHVIGHAPGSVPVNAGLVAVVAAAELPVDAKQAALCALVDMTLQLRHPACCAAAGCDICTPSPEGN
ncbi:hypothetical protein GCM10027053_52050 [Intrasporangium mesophilum]